MSATREGGLKAAATNRAYYGANFYARIGSIGGKKSGKPKGFAWMAAHGKRYLVQAAGHKGGKKRLGWRKRALQD